MELGSSCFHEAKFKPASKQLSAAGWTSLHAIDLFPLFMQITRNRRCLQWHIKYSTLYYHNV